MKFRVNPRLFVMKIITIYCAFHPEFMFKVYQEIREFDIFFVTNG